MISLCIFYVKECVFLTQSTGNISNPSTIQEILHIPSHSLTQLSVIFGGIFGLIALLCIIRSFQQSQNISYAVAIISSTSAITALLSFLLFGISIQLNGVIGISLIIMGCYFITKTNNQTTTISYS